MAQRSVFGWLGRKVFAHPFPIIFLFAAVVAAALLYLRDFPLRTSYLDLLPARDPLVERYEEVQAEIKGLDLAAILLSLQEPPESLEERANLLRTAADHIISELDPKIIARASYFLRAEVPLPPELLVFRTLYPQERERLAAIAGELLARVPALTGAYPLALPAELPADPEGLTRLLSQVTQAGHTVLAVLQELPELEALVAEAKDIIQRAQSRAIPEDQGHLLLSADRTQLVIQVWPTRPVYASQAFNRAVRDELRRAVQAAHLEEMGIEAGLAGGYVVATEVEDVIKRDMMVVTIISSVAVFLLALLSLGSPLLAILALVPILVSAVLILAWAKFAVHGFNLLTAFLPALVLGLGIDYSLHLLSRFSEARRKGAPLSGAVIQAVHTKGRAAAVAALTTAAVFCCLLLSQSRALWEMGVIMSVGLVVSFFSVFLLGPALLAFVGKLFPKLQGRPLLSPERLYHPYRHLLLLRKGIILFSLLFVVLATIMATKVEFKFTSAELAPATPGQGVLNEIIQNFGGEIWLGDTFRVFVPKVRLLYEYVEKLKGHPLVHSVVSARDLLPGELLGQAIQLQELPIPQAQESLEHLSEALNRWGEITQELKDKAALFSLGELEALLRGEVRRALVFSQKASEFFHLAQAFATVDTAALLKTVAALAEDLKPLAEFAAKLQALPPEEELVDQILALLPQEIRTQYRISRGYIVELRVTPELYRGRNLREFLAWLRGFGLEYVGSPELQLALEEHMRRDFFLTTGIALFFIFLLVIVDFRHLGKTGLALAPLAMGYACMLGGMATLRLRFNFTNIVISPLLIGLGVDGAVHLLHRWEEEQGREAGIWAAAATAGPTLGSYLTTMASFGALLAAHTPGLRYLGAAALLGLGFTTLWTLLFLPGAVGELRKIPGKTKVP